MHVMLQTRGLWIAVTKGISSYTEDRMALEVISNAMSVGMMGSIASKVSTKVVWESMTLRNAVSTVYARQRQAPSFTNLIHSRSTTVSRWMISARTLVGS
jgi:hypothetical protein